MRKKRFILAAMAMLLTAFTFQACSTDDDTDWSKVFPNALVTVKQNGDATYLQLDDNTTLYPKNIKKPFGDKEVRALVNYSVTQEKSEGYNQVVYVNWIDSILTKQPVPSLGSTEQNAQKYGEDMVDIVRDWVTIAEDGYLTLRFRALWGGVKVHYINLVSGINPENPYEVELRHNANGDPQMRWGDALVAFNLNNVLPDTNGKTVKLKIRWKSSQGEKTVEFDYCSRKSIPSPSLLNGYSQSAIGNMK